MPASKPHRRYLFPAIDLLGGQVVRLVRGDYEQVTAYPGHAVEAARQFEDAGATWLHVVDLDGARTGQSVHLDEIRDICQQTNLNVEVGGGVRSEQTIDELLEIGVSRAIVGTAALNHWDWFEGLMDNPKYHNRLVLGLDAREGELAVSGWQSTTKQSPQQIAKQVCDWPLAAIVYTDIATDGTMEGPNLQTTRQMSQTTNVPILASGGVGILEHLRQLATLPIQGAICGRALYEQRFTLDEALAIFED